MPRIDDENHFRTFAANLETALQKYVENPDESLLVRQRAQLKALVALETTFRRTLIDHPWGPGVYRDFVTFICDTKRNILDARPYFRERQTMFTKKISGCLKKRSDRDLYPFRFNWTFITFVLKSRKWPAGGKIVQLSKQIDKLRQELLEQNIPLAISQARIFWSNTPKSHLSYMDIVQIQCQALLLAIDKFSPPSDKKRMSEQRSLEEYRRFRSVAIGIMSRDRVNGYSATLVHFYPKDKLKIYRAHKAMRRFAGEVDYEKLAEIVNKDLDLAERTNAIEIADLVGSASTVSADFSPDPEGDSVIDSYVSADDSRPDLLIEEHQASHALLSSVRELSIKEQKMLKMQGVKL
jgi:DNA-directed RNA polymerase specialized sigma subunit